MATKEMVWNIEVEGVPYKIVFDKSKVSVNGAEPVKLNKLKKKSSSWETHYSIPIAEKEAVLHIRQFSAPVLSYEDRDCSTGEAYVPLKAPFWVWIFVVLHALDFFLIIGGAIGGVLQALVISMMVAVSTNQKKSTGVRVLACLGIWLASTIVQFIFAVGLVLLME